MTPIVFSHRLRRFSKIVLVWQPCCGVALAKPVQTILRASHESGVCWSPAGFQAMRRSCSAEYAIRGACGVRWQCAQTDRKSVV